jgi:hypothetical protein
MPTKTPLALLVEEGPIPVPLNREIQRYVLRVETDRKDDSRSFKGLAKDPVTGMSKDPQIIDWSEIPCEVEGWRQVEVFLLPDGTDDFIEISAEFNNQGSQTRRLQVALPSIERFTPKLSPGKNLEITFFGKFLTACRIEALDQTDRIRYWGQNARQNRITLEIDVHPGNRETIRFQLINPIGNVITQTVTGEELAVILDGPQDPNQPVRPIITKPADRGTEKTSTKPPAKTEAQKPSVEAELTEMDLNILAEQDNEEETAEEPPWESWAEEDPEIDLSDPAEYEDLLEKPFELRKKSWLKVVMGIAIFAVPLLINFFFFHSFLKMDILLFAIGGVVFSFGYLFFWMQKFRFSLILLLIINLLGIGAGVVFTKTSWFSKTPPQPQTLMMIIQDNTNQPVAGADIFLQNNDRNNGVLLATSDSLGRVSMPVKPKTAITVECDGYQVDTVSAKPDQVIRLIKLTKAKVYLISAVNCQVEVKTDDGQILQTVNLDGPEPAIIDVPVQKNIIFDFRVKGKVWKADTLNIPSTAERWSVEIDSSEKLKVNKM